MIVLPAAYQGLQYDRVVQAKNADGTNATSIYTSGSVLSAQVWEGDSQVNIFSPTVIWYTANATQNGYDQGQVSVAMSAAQTTLLTPGGTYYLLITQITSAIAAPVWEGRLPVAATAGTTTISPPDLATYDYVLGQLAMSGVYLTDAQSDQIPYLIAAASQAIRRYCFDRFFTLSTFTESYPVALDGFVRLYQVPVNQVRRIQGQPQLALTISNTSSSVQYATVAGTFTGQYGGFGTNAQTLTGILLTIAISGTVTTNTITFTSNQTIASVASAIAGVGSGWTATADSVLGLWPATELDGLNVAQGASVSAMPANGALYNVLADIDCAQFPSNYQATGMIWVGQQWGQSNAAQWGPGGESMFGYFNQPTQGKVKVTYSAGFTTVPPDIQYWTAQLVKWKIEVSRTDFLLKSEKAADYSYELVDVLAKGMAVGMPPSVMQGLAQWRLHYA